MQNRSHYNGGAIHNNFKLTVFNDEYSSNKAKIAGAIYNKDCLKIMGDVTFSNNISDFIEPVYNANLITSKRNLEGNVHDTGFINVEKGSAESFTD